MAKHLIFFVHGMGSPSNNWHEPAISFLRNSFNDYQASKTVSYDDLFEHKTLMYGEIFSKWHEPMKNDFTAFKKTLVGQMDSADKRRFEKSVKGRLDTISKHIGSGETGFLWTHALDVILYRFSSTIRMAVDVRIATQLTGALRSGFRSWSIVGHSLGTSVVHNSLNSLYSTGFFRKDNTRIPPLNAKETRPEALIMVANVSRVIQRPDAKVYDTNVKPGIVPSKRLCASYLNIRHRYDPFTIARPFDPDANWIGPKTFESEDYQHIQPSHVAFGESELGKIHSLEHYLINPRVHVPIFREILGRHVILRDEFESKRDKFDEQLSSDHIDKIRKQLESKFPHATKGNWDSLVSLIRSLFK